jgi:hypothetical protein
MQNKLKASLEDLIFGQSLGEGKCTGEQRKRYLKRKTKNLLPSHGSNESFNKK